MARTPTADRPPIARWLIESRKAQAHPETGKPWTADYFLERLEASGGWAPNISNYAQWESGQVTPKDENLAPVIAFYASLGVAGPETPEAIAPAPDLATVLRELAQSSAAMAQSNEAMAAQLAAMRIEIAALQRERAAWQHGVVAAMAEVEGRVPSALLASLAPQPS